MTCAAILTDPAGFGALTTPWLWVGVALGALAWEAVWPVRRRRDDS